VIIKVWITMMIVIPWSAPSSRALKKFQLFLFNIEAQGGEVGIEPCLYSGQGRPPAFQGIFGNQNGLPLS